MKQKAYAGNGRPFVYALYAPEDQEGAEAVFNALREKGYDTWPSVRFDRRRMKKAALVLFVLSKAALESDTMNRAIDHAVQTDQPMLAVYLEQAELTPAQKLLLNTQQGILRYDCENDADFQEKLFGCSLLQNLTVTRAQKRAALLTTWGIAAGVLAAAALTVILALGLNASVPEDSLVAEFGYTGRIRDITEVWIYGGRTMDACAEKVFAALKYSGDISTENALYYDNGEHTMLFGTTDDISDFSQLRYLEQLALAGNEITDLSPLFQLKNLYYLDVSVNPIQSIEGIGAMEALRTIYLGFTYVTDFSPLLDCPEIEQVYVDLTQQDAAQDALSAAGIDVTVVGPAEELDKLKCHIFSGPFEGNTNSPYGIWYMTTSRTLYTDYTYSVTKNGEPVTISEIDLEDDNGDGEPDKTHLMLDQATMGDYDTDAVYVLEVSYGGQTARYQVWHKHDTNHPLADKGLLLTD